MIRVTSRTLLLTCVGASSMRVFAAEPATSRDEGRLIEEVVVTAQKRLERLQDVPVPVSVVDAGALMESNQVRLQDYYTRLPGLSLTTDTYGQPSLAIRGLTTGTGNPTVGITVDDLPYGSITGLGRVAPDLDPSDLAQVEVLRGPQGTLYGASSIGGLLKFVTADPTTDAVSGRVQAGVSTVHEGDTGYNFRGSINLPLGETWALRASAFTRRDPGYIDDPTYDERDVNEVDVAGGRVVALWQPSESVSVKLGAYLQSIDAQGSASAHDLPGLGDLEQSMLIDTGGYERKMQIYSANVRALSQAPSLHTSVAMESTTSRTPSTTRRHLVQSAKQCAVLPVRRCSRRWRQSVLRKSCESQCHWAPGSTLSWGCSTAMSRPGRHRTSSPWIRSTEQ